LFNAFGYVHQRNNRMADELRPLIAGIVMSDPLTYNDGFLGRTNDEYCTAIMNPQVWGGSS
jgi:ubiquitin thioesterase OTU1